MKINKFTIAAIFIIAILTIVFIMIFLAINKRIETTAVPEGTPQAIEVKDEAYAIPDNVIPTETDIESSINKSRERNAIAERAREARRAAQKIAAPVSAAAPAERSKKPADAIPAKEEFKFPTHEERKAMESMNGAVSF